MAIEDNDVFDRAFEAAEAKLADSQPTEEITQADEPAVETPTEDLVETQEIQKVIEKATKPAEKAPKQKAPAIASKAKQAAPSVAPQQISDQQPTDALEPQATEEVVTEIIEAPQFWSADKKELFAKAPPELQRAITEHEAQRNEYVHRLANESERGRAIEKRVGEVFKPYELKLKALGINDPMQAAERLMAWNEIIESDPLTAVKTLMERNGLTPQDLMYQDYGDGQPQGPYQSDPRVDEVIAKAEAAERKLQEWQESQQTAALHNEVNAFKNSKDSSGQIRKAFAEMYAPQISQAAEAIARINPQLSIGERLTQAYDYVQTEVRKLVGGAPVAAPKPVAQIAAQAKKAQAAASSVTGAPSSGTSPQRPGAKTIDEAIDRAFERAGV